jgi:hypothetical protein
MVYERREIPHFRGVRVHMSTGYNPGEENRRASRNGRVSDRPPERYDSQLFASLDHTVPLTNDRYRGRANASVICQEDDPTAAAAILAAASVEAAAAWLAAMDPTAAAKALAAMDASVAGTLLSAMTDAAALKAVTQVCVCVCPSSCLSQLPL